MMLIAVQSLPLILELEFRWNRCSLAMFVVLVGDEFLVEGMVLFDPHHNHNSGNLQFRRCCLVRYLRFHCRNDRHVGCPVGYSNCEVCPRKLM